MNRGLLRTVQALRRVTSPLDVIKFIRHQGADGTFEIFVRSLDRAVALRGNTTDLECFEKVILDRDYECPFPTENVKLIVDAGANTGLASVFFATRFPKARVIAIEPEKHNAQILRRNTAGLNVIVHEAALWPRQERLPLFDHGQDFAYTVKDSFGGKSIGTVDTITIPQILQQHGGYIDILKLDIEGAENDLMQSADWLDHVGTIVIELHDRFRDGCAQTLYRAINGRDFRQEVKGENIFIKLH